VVVDIGGWIVIEGLAEYRRERCDGGRRGLLLRG